MKNQKLKTSSITLEEVMAKSKIVVEQVTLSEVQLGRMLKEIPKAPANQYTSANSTEAEKAKTETIKELGFSKDQVSQFQRMADHEESKRENITTWANCRKS